MSGDIVVGLVVVVALALAVARGTATPEQLREGGAAAVLAELQELLVGAFG